MTARYLPGPFPTRRDKFDAPVRFHPIGEGKSVTFAEWQCMECGEVVTDCMTHRRSHE